MGNLPLQFLVELAFEFANFSASHASHVDMVARAVALVKVTVATKVKKIEFVNQALAFQQIEGSIDGDASDPGSIFWARSRISSASRCRGRFPSPATVRGAGA